MALDCAGELVASGALGKLGDELVDGARAVDLVHIDRHDAAADCSDGSNEALRTLGVVDELDSYS